jgi:hypothetical protein
MYSSPCSLRSTQCATLIALAAAAGISRTEQPQTTYEPAQNNQQVAHAGTFFATPTRGFHFASTSPAPWFRPTVIAAPQEIRPCPENASPTHPVGDDKSPPCAPVPCVTLVPGPSEPSIVLALLPPHTPALSARKHSYPYAVGPPPCGTHPQLRAAGTEVPGDSPACRNQVSRIARVSNLIPQQRAPRATDQSPKSAGQLSPRIPPCAANRNFRQLTPAFVRAFARPRSAAP